MIAKRQNFVSEFVKRGDLNLAVPFYVSLGLNDCEMKEQKGLKSLRLRAGMCFMLRNLTITTLFTNNLVTWPTACCCLKARAELALQLTTFVTVVANFSTPGITVTTVNSRHNSLKAFGSRLGNERFSVLFHHLPAAIGLISFFAGTLSILLFLGKFMNSAAALGCLSEVLCSSRQKDPLLGGPLI